MLPRQGWTNSSTSIVYAYEKNGVGKCKKTKLSNFCEKCNTYAWKNVSSDIIPVVKRKENRLYDIFAMKVAFSDLYFVFRIFLLISYMF